MTTDLSWLGRTELLIGREALTALAQKHVMVVGLGGVGSYAAEFIARSGIGKMTIIDGDVVDPTNRNRQLPALATNHGVSKADIMAERLKAINPELELNVVKSFINPEMVEALLALKPDYTIDAIDSITPKLTFISIAYRNKPPANDLLVQTCARCHARAEHIDGNYNHGQSIFNTHIPAELNTDFYHTDGQQLGEDYEYGSFLQSKMYAMGVTCNNCHNTHSGQLKLAGNAVCSQCHSPQVFDVPQHTNHPVNTAGAQCISCHMPSKNYMQIDARLDHKIFIPRPDLSAKLNTPDACSSCHADKTKSWVVNAFEKWYGEKIKQKPVTYGELLSKVNKYEEKGDSAMIQLLAANAYPSIVQATAMLQAYNYTSPAIAEPLTQSLSSGNDLLRYYSLRAISNFPAEQITAQVSPLLADATLAVRAEAARVLAPVNDKLDAASKQKFDTAIAEYINIQKFNGNRPESYMNTGIVLQEMQKFTDAQQMYELGIKRFPKFEALYINLADVYRNGNRDDLCESTLQKVLSINPSNAVALQSYGFLLVRKNKTNEAISYLKKAADMQPAEADYSYSYAVALFSTGKTKEAVSLLENFQKKNPNNPIIINTLISFYQQMQMQDKANAYNEIRKKVFGG